MSKIVPLFLLIFSVISFGIQAQSTTHMDGILAPVEIMVDPYGISHIYAQNESDLFFAQGYSAARDRLFQFEIWRRQATGTVSEILGKRELKRDIGTRLFQFRGNMDDEMNYYHARGKLIIESFVKGVNAYIEEVLKDPSALPMEFGLLGILPMKWTPRDVISRHQGLLGNIDDELDNGRLVALLGEEKLREISWFHPQEPNLKLDSKIDQEVLFENILELYNAYRRPVQFRPEDLVASVREDDDKYKHLAAEWNDGFEQLMRDEKASIGSNNWVVSGDHTQSGYPIMANDPHRTLASPSLRYMTHLVAPGWNVIGGGEPEIPGISIGHNEYGAWGLTVYRTDAEDLYVYKINPDNKNQYWYNDGWEDMELIHDTIKVRDQEPEIVTHKYTRHGPVLYVNTTKNTAFAIRCGWLEIGGSPYLASLRMDQAKTWEEFRLACNYSHIPGENMIWADRAGNIGWQAVGIAPRRTNFSGLVPVPGDGSYEWDDYLPIIEKPSLYNPESGFVITANEDVTPLDYQRWEAVGYGWGDTYRGDRLSELLKNGRAHSIMDMAKYQTDYLSIPARQLQPLISHAQVKSGLGNMAKDLLINWDCVMDIESREATIYVELENMLKQKYEAVHVPEEARPFYAPQLKVVMDWVLFPDETFGPDPMNGRDSLLGGLIEEVVNKLINELGDISKWQYGQNDYKHVLIKHPLSNAVNEKTRKKLDVGPAPRGGYGYTVGNTSNNLNQRSGASFRIIVDTEDWDHTLAMNSPGQSGNPDHKNYKNLFNLWAQDRFFPLYYSRPLVEKNTVEKIILMPKD
jgi:penicillin amidase